MADTVKFKDEFTDDDGTALTSHQCDVGGGDWADVNSGTEVSLAEIRDNKLQTINDVGSGYNFGWFIYNDSDIEFAVGDEIYCDLVSNDHTINAVQALMFCMLPNEDSDIAEHYALGYQRTSSSQVRIIAQTAFVTATTTIKSGVDWAISTGLRLGVTLTSKTSFDVWTEPLGGGTRTAIGTWTPDADYFDSSHNNVGLQKGSDSGGASTSSTFDTLTVVAPDNPCFETDYDCASATAATVTQATDPTAVTATQVVPDSRMVLGDGCIPDATLGAYS